MHFGARAQGARVELYGFVLPRNAELILVFTRGFKVLLKILSRGSRASKSQAS